MSDDTDDAAGDDEPSRFDEGDDRRRLWQAAA